MNMNIGALGLPTALIELIDARMPLFGGVGIVFALYHPDENTCGFFDFLSECNCIITP